MKKFFHWPLWVIFIALVFAALFPGISLFHSAKPSIAHAIGNTAPTISLAASIVHPGEQVAATGRNFAPGDSVTIYVSNSYTLGTIYCDNNGNCSGIITIVTQGLPQGYYQVIGYGTSGLTAQTSVTLYPRLFVNVKTGGPGTPIQLTGFAFAVNETVQVYWKGSQKISEGSATTDYTGSLFLNFNTPTGLIPGTYFVTVVRSHQAPVVVRTPFQLLAPKLLSSGGIRNNQAIHVQLSGFQSQENVTMSWNANNGQTISTLTMGMTGAIDTYIAPPFAPKGVYTLTAKGNTSGLQAMSSLSIGPGILLTPNTANPGGTITVNGGGYTTGETVDIYFQNPANGITTAIVDGQGSFSVSLFVPVTHKQNVLYYVYANSTTGTDKSRTEFYYMTPALLGLNCTYGSPMTISGLGFTAQESVDLYWEFSGQAHPLKLGTTLAAKDGTFNFTTIAPSSPYDLGLPNTFIVARGAVSKTKATAPVYEQPAIFVHPTSGPIGSKVHVSGGNFSGGGTATITFQSILVATVTVQMNGAFTATFVVPDSVSLGENTLAVTNSPAGFQLTTLFTVTH